jgi:hypothetical protein
MRRCPWINTLALCSSMARPMLPLPYTSTSTRQAEHGLGAHFSDHYYRRPYRGPVAPPPYDCRASEVVLSKPCMSLAKCDPARAVGTAAMGLHRPFRLRKFPVAITGDRAHRRAATSHRSARCVIRAACRDMVEPRPAPFGAAVRIESRCWLTEPSSVNQSCSRPTAAIFSSAHVHPRAAADAAADELPGNDEGEVLAGSLCYGASCHGSGMGVRTDCRVSGA